MCLLYIALFALFTSIVDAKTGSLTECNSNSNFNPTFSPTNLTRISYGQSHASTLRSNNDTVIAYISSNSETILNGKFCLREKNRPHVKVCKRINNNDCTTLDLCSITTNYPNVYSGALPAVFDVIASKTKIYVLTSGISSLVIYVCKQSFEECTFIDTKIIYGIDFISTYNEYLYVAYSNINEIVHLLTCDDGSCTDKTVTSIPIKNNEIPYAVPKVVNGILYIFTQSTSDSTISIYVCDLKADTCKLSYTVKGLGYLGITSDFNVLTLGTSHYIAYHNYFGGYTDLSVARCDINNDGYVSTCNFLHGSNADNYIIGFKRPSIAYAPNLDAVVTVSTVISGNKDVAIFVANTRMASDGIASFAVYSTNKHSTTAAAYRLMNMDETTGLMKMTVQESEEVGGLTEDLYLYDISMFKDCIQLQTPIVLPPASTKDMPIHYAGFITSQSLNQISSVISSTAYSRTSSNKRVAATDPLTSALERVKNYKPTKTLFNKKGPTVNLTPNKRSLLAQKPNVQNIVSLTDMTHAWLANNNNAHVIQKSIVTNPSVRNVEKSFSQSLYGSCININKYSQNVISPATKKYCCDTKGNLPRGNLAIVCNSKIRKDINAYMTSAHVAPVFANIGNKKSNVQTQSSHRRKILDDKPSCSGFDLSNLYKGILPKVSCCFMVSVNLELCIKVSGEVDYVGYTKGSNNITIHKGIYSNTYCWPQHIQADGLLHSASCQKTQQFTEAIFDDTATNAAVDVQATLCITGGDILDFLANDLGFDDAKLCVAELEIKYYEALQTMAFYLKAGIDIKILDLDLVVEGELQLAYRPNLCEFLWENFNPNISPACNMLATHGCWWNSGDSNLEFTITLQLLGFSHNSWTWPIFTKADLPNPPCPPLVGTAAGTPVLVPTPVFITQVGMSFCVRKNSDGKDSNTKGSITFSFDDNTVIATIPIPDGEWKDGSRHTLSKNLNLQPTQAQLKQHIHVHIDWATQGHDQIIFYTTIFVNSSDGIKTSPCFDNEKIPNCGKSCFLKFSCPTNHCPWDKSFGFRVPYTGVNQQCCS